MAALYDVVANSFLAMLPYLELSDKTVRWDASRQAVRDFAERYGVAWDHPPSIEAFYRACLGKVKSE